MGPSDAYTGTCSFQAQIQGFSPGVLTLKVTGLTLAGPYVIFYPFCWWAFAASDPKILSCIFSTKHPQGAQSVFQARFQPSSQGGQEDRPLSRIFDPGRHYISSISSKIAKWWPYIQLWASSDPTILPAVSSKTDKTSLKYPQGQIMIVRPWSNGQNSASVAGILFKSFPEEFMMLKSLHSNSFSWQLKCCFPI